MNKSVIFLILIAVGFAAWIVSFIFSKVFSKGGGLKNYKSLAEKYSLNIDEFHKEGKIKLPLLTGSYRDFPVSLGAMLKPDSVKKTPVTFIAAECENKDNFSFVIARRSKENKIKYGSAESPIGDKEFDEKFIVNTNNSGEMSTIMNFNIKYKLIQAQHLGAYGDLILNGNKVLYTEDGYISSDTALMKAEIILHLVCDIADEMKRIKPVIG